ncbi:PREDICTED: E3 ubiquitin-protein ligase RBBP6 isoform X2 [Nicrophorus vespilloides]|uniref:E3 ubiquitin-protein ligase RBBP6 isoform X2 n=1 Tax=Nicrophorus vespilloides TaxID=110193 RepID=A0ABM1M1G8_NICVS|nr:PREDICTED: E3 ubiquitin-protein ligase RBBP6 isoform X2 [Nicrophorus vespilloides]
MSVHYKFKSALEYDTITFDGLHISVKDLKNAIVQQKRIGKNTDFDLQVTNAQTKEVYEDDQTLIPKNTSLLIARIPLAVQSKSKTWEGYGNDTNLTPRNDEGGPAAKAVDLSSLDASEDDKIRAMMSQSTQDYDPSNYMKIRGANQVGAVPPNYRCYKCHQNGHWIKDCPLGQGSEQIEIKKSTGIPRSFMVPVDGPQVQGAMMTPYGSYAVPALDHQTYTQKQNPAPAPPPVQKTDIPEDLLCSICSDLLTDAVMIPCCGNSFCDECIRGILLESEDHECPDCHEREISPGTLIPNRFLRNSVTNFKSTTGYVKRQIYKPAMLQQQQQQQQPATIIKKDPVPVNETAPSVTAVADDVKTKKLDSDAENTEKTVISEADSTEAPKTPISEGLESKEEIKEPSEEKVEPVDLPPGVSPTREKSPVSVTRPIVINTTQQARDRSHTASVRPKSLNERSPRRSHKPHRSPQNYPEPIGNNEERPGTPTVDEPGMGGANNAESRTYPPTNAPYPSGPPPPPVVISSNINHMQVRQVPPPNYSQQPVSQYGGAQGIIPHGPPPNFRLPPPGAGAPPNFIPGMYNVQQRPMFDPTRPPMQGPHNYQNYSNRSRGRDYVPRGMRGRTPPGIIDDPLEAFNRMLREKDERERRAKQRKGRSYSRSSSRSYSRSPRRRSRSPRRRSRSKSFSMSRSRSRSYSPANRASPYRDYSPRRRPSSRYRSPQRSPNSRYRYKEERREREYERDRDHRDRDRERDRDRDRERDRGSGDYGGKREHRGYSRDRGGSGMSGGGAAPSQDYHYYDNFEAEKGRRGGGSSTKWVAPRESAYYHQQDHQNAYHQAGPQSSVQQHPASNRYMQQREQQYGGGGGGYKSDHIPSLMQQQIPSQRSRYEDVAPPGTEQPLPPGEEPSRYDERYNSYDNRPSVAAAVAGNQEQQLHQHQHRFSIDRDNHDSKYGMGKLVVEEFEKREEKRHSSKSPSRRSRDRGDKERAHGEHMKSPDKHKHKDRSSKAEELSERRKDDKKKADYSDDEKSKRSRDKKKKRDKKESEKKKKRDKKEKREHRKEDKSKSKDESSSSNKQHHEHHHAKEEKPKEEKRAMSPLPSKEGGGSSSPAPPVELKEAASSHHQIANADHHQTAEARENSPKLPEEEPDLYGDILSEGIDNTIVESYGKIDERSRSPVDRNRSPDHPVQLEMPKSPELLKESGDILELYTGELKSELDKEVLAPMPEKSKWELDDEPSNALSELNSDSKSDKANKVTNEVLKRAENAIFAKAINAIRPIEIKKISMDRVKLYSGEKEEKKEEEIKPEEFSENPEPEPVKQELEQQKPIRLSVKERLGCKVDDLDRIVRVEKNYDRNRSRSLSPLAKRSQDLRRIEIDNDKRRERPHHDSRDRDRHHRNYRNTERRDHERREHESKREHGSGGTSESRRGGGGGGGGQEKERNRSRERRRERSRSRQRKDDDTGKREKRKRSRSRSDEKKQKKRDKKHQKKEKPKKHHRKEDEAPQSQQPPTSSTSQPLLTGNSKSSDQKTIDPEKILKRKTPLDEANFVPDYDAETESEGDQKKEKVSRGKSPEKRRVAKVAVDEKKESTSSDSSSSSSDDEKKKKKHKKHKKRKRRESTSSSSDSDSSSSEDEKDRRKKKHKKKQKKKKKSKHK